MTLRDEDIQNIALQVAPAVKQLLATDEKPQLALRMGGIEQELRNQGRVLQTQGAELHSLDAAHA